MPFTERLDIVSKKIIVLNGSPRNKGNTSALIDSFSEGAEEHGHVVTRFNLQRMHIHPCMGCLEGEGRLESPCKQDDDMNKVYPAFEEADIVVFASPLYYWSFSAQLKIALDRLFAVTEAHGMKTPKKECAMLIAAEEDSPESFAPIVDYYNLLMKNLGWEDKGMVLAGGVYKVGDIAGKPSLGEAKKLGASM